ncbi:YaaC family protein [Rossellomorea vietnamensis]|uniref:YaaC family protein n=1 Tax=Rossellomorea vietnamensis TaxID=218284 RepID=A0ACD4C2S7_9BACI|nr:YaaC family protein [Rossellomorea vietnamensis]UXH42929.1 YaaC family protein [Rossellomorea vietnamensis]
MNEIRQHWDFIHYFQSAEYSQKFLKKCYEKLGSIQAEVKSYDNCYPFMYYLEQGELYYKQAMKSPFSLKPILLFYGYIHFIKAIVLTEDPEYPETTTVLAHGITSRKRKKQQYRFLQDEVKVQKNGLFSHFSDLVFHVKHIIGEKYKMEDLLVQIPELEEAFLILLKKKTMFWFTNQNKLTIDESLLSHFHMSGSLFKQYLNEKMTGNSLSITEDTLHATSAEELLPVRWHLNKNRLALPGIRNEASGIPEVLIHYAILYNLSMIARYETEWWVELLKNRTNEDYPIITTFLNVTTEKSPYLLLKILKDKT